MEKQNRARNILKHLGSAHTEAELAALMLTGQEKLPAEQQSRTSTRTQAASP